MAFTQNEGAKAAHEAAYYAALARDKQVRTEAAINRALQRMSAADLALSCAVETSGDAECRRRYYSAAIKALHKAQNALCRACAVSTGEAPYRPSRLRDLGRKQHALAMREMEDAPAAAAYNAMGGAVLSCIANAGEEASRESHQRDLTELEHSILVSTLRSALRDAEAWASLKAAYDGEAEDMAN